MSLVPENPMALSTLEWSHEEEVMELLNWIISFGNTHFISQKATHRLFFLKISSKCFL